MIAGLRLSLLRKKVLSTTLAWKALAATSACRGNRGCGVPELEEVLALWRGCSPALGQKQCYTTGSIEENTPRLKDAVRNVRKMMQRNNSERHEVVEVTKRGDFARYTCTDIDVLRKVKDKSFQYRDLSLLQTSDVAKRHIEILVRDRSIVLRLFGIQAIIQSDWCMLFGSQRPHIEQAAHHLKKEVSAISKGKTDNAMFLNQNLEKDSCSKDKGLEKGSSTSEMLELINTIETLGDEVFEHRSLECILTSSINRLDHQTGQTCMLVDVVLREIGNDVESLRKVLPLKQKVEALRSDVEAMLSVLSETLAQDEDMANMNLTWIDENQGLRPPSTDHLEVEAILETSRREVQQIGRLLSQVNERIDDTREVLNISLDSQRNRILALNLQTSLVTLSLTAIAVPAGILGMNIPLGLEEDASAFPAVLTSMFAVGICMYIIPVSYLYYGFFLTSKRRVKEIIALQNLVHDMDIVERTFYKMASKGHATRKDFARALSEATQRPISTEEMNLLCKAFGPEGDEELQLETYRRIVEHKSRSPMSRRKKA